jgi:hypothetical protein
MQNVDKVKLPSNGLLGAPEEVGIRSMTGREISTIFSSLNEESLNRVISAVTEPNLDPSTLCDEDKYFILHKTRTLTFGDEIVQTLKCPFCNHMEEYTINYDQFDLKYLAMEDLAVEVTVGKDTVISRKIPLRSDWEKINTYKEKRKLTDDYAYILLQAAKVDKVNGERKSLGEVVTLLESIPGNDLVRLARVFDLRFGLDTTYIQPCGKCKIDLTGGVGINADMFR